MSQLCRLQPLGLNASRPAHCGASSSSTPPRSCLQVTPQVTPHPSLPGRCAARCTAGRWLAHGRHARPLAPCSAIGSEPGQEPGPPSILDNERLIASITSIGISGSLAIGGAQLAGVNLWNQFHFTQVDDLKLAAVCGSVLLAYEAFLLALPWYLGLNKAPEASSSSSEAAASAVSEDQPSSAPTTVSSSPFNLSIDASLSDAGQALSLPLLRSTMALQQACFVATATMMRAEIPTAVDAGLIVARESAKELLQRGLFVTFLSGWLSDRCFEAGADDMVQLMGSPVYTTEACRWFVASLATLLILPPVLADAKALSLSVATNSAVMAMSGKTKADDEASELVQEYRLFEALQRTVDAWPARLTRAAHTLRGILRFSTINAVFAVTQNLSASLSVAVVSNLLLLAYAVRGRQALGLKTQKSPPKAGRKMQKPPTLRWPEDKDDKP